MGVSKLLLFLFAYPIILLSLATTLTLAVDVYFVPKCNETAGNFTENSAYHANLNRIVSQLSSLTQFNYGFYNLSAGQSPDQVYATALCTGDRTQSQCNDCLNYTVNELRSACPSNKEAMAWSQFCLVRYANRNLYGQLENDPRTCAYNPLNATHPDTFNNALSQLLVNLSSEAAAGGPLRKYAADNTTDGELQTVYAMVQCSPDMDEQNCTTCLNYARRELLLCCAGRLGCRVLRPTCILRFESDPFYQPTVALPSPPPPSPISSPPSVGGKKNSTARTVIIVIASVVGALVMVILSVCIFYRYKRKSERAIMDDEITGAAESLQFDLDTVLVATNNFSDENKLGQGGFGAVYKGKLPNGQEVAVKRLSRESGQGDQEFKNEVMLLAKLQHRNLVRLFGFCLERDERLLIYEFVPNGSLDHFIFDPVKRSLLGWETCYKIIGGIARGLLYLHEDSRLRIIHRDLKAGNILLDEEMVPKIADFGMARLFGQDETQAKTSRVVGTYGYMAPEYVIHGQFSVKSDVFSFGVLILEIVTGQKSNSIRQGESCEYLLNFVWRNWREDTPLNIIDPTLMSSNYSSDEMVRCINIGLLCIQENVDGRPTIASALHMLNSFSTGLPVPSQPAFAMLSHIQSDGSTTVGTGSWPSESTNQGQLPPVSNNEVTLTDLSPR